ncbi:MAG: hypothetical protein AB7P17_09905 [Nitrospirales bacterium]|nr:hypothetical protein [Nitrospirales bacterium]
MKIAEIKWVSRILGGLVLCLLVGCQSFQTSAPGELNLPEDDFVGLWDAYNFCMVDQDISQIQANLSILQNAPKPISLNESPIPIPKFIQELTSLRSSRLAVDPRAMAASCSIHMAEVAQRSNDWDTAYRILETMATNFPEPQYVYYVTKANDTLEQLNSTMRPVSLPLREAFVQ